MALLPNLISLPVIMGNVHRLPTIIYQGARGGFDDIKGGVRFAVPFSYESVLHCFITHSNTLYLRFEGILTASKKILIYSQSKRTRTANIYGSLLEVVLKNQILKLYWDGNIPFKSFDRIYYLILSI